MWSITKGGKRSRVCCSCFSPSRKCLPSGESLTVEKDELASMIAESGRPHQREVKSDTRQFYSDAADITKWLGD